MDRLIRAALLFAVLLPFTATAQNRIYVNEYLNIGVGARGLAMAGSEVACANDATAAFYNPAGLMNIKNDAQVGLMHAEYFSGNAKYDYAGIVIPTTDKKHVIGISALRYATDDIPYTIDLVQPDNSIDESKLKSISAGDYAFIFSYAQRVKMFYNDDLDQDDDIETQFGVNAKLIYRQIGSMANAWGAGVDAGFQNRYKRFHFGLMLKDITTTYTAWTFHLTDHEKQVFGQTGNEIPVKSYEVMLPRANLGFGFDLFKKEKSLQLYAEADLDITSDGHRNTVLSSNRFAFDPHVGFEASYKNTIFLRAGVGNIQRVLDDADTSNTKKYTLFQPSIGAGLKIKMLMIDYCYTSLQTQSNPMFSHIISLRLDINRPTWDERDDRAAHRKTVH